jgi:hypothetical protein
VYFVKFKSIILRNKNNLYYFKYFKNKLNFYQKFHPEIDIGDSNSQKIIENFVNLVK